jgi:hypothetical protein
VQSQVKGESEAQVSVPVHVYGPEGVADFLDVVLATSDTCLYVPVVVFEFVPGPVEDGYADMECLNARSRLYRVCSLRPLATPPSALPAASRKRSAQNTCFCYMGFFSQERIHCFMFLVFASLAAQ